MTWERKFENIKARKFDDVIGQWARRSPASIEIGQHSLSNHIFEIVEPALIPLDGQTFIGPIESRPLFSELYFGVTKAFNLNFNAQRWSQSRAYTNGSLHSFCSVIQIMQAIMALFGVFIVRSKGKYYVVDLFPWFGHNKEDRAMRKNFGDAWWQYGRIISDKKTLIHQDEIVLLFQRCLRVVTVQEVWQEAIIGELSACEQSWFNRPRNNVMYNFSGWLDNSDLTRSYTKDCVEVVRAAAASIFDVESLIAVGSLPQSLLLASLLGKIWERLAGAISLELGGKAIDMLPQVGDRSLITHFESALGSAMEGKTS